MLFIIKLLCLRENAYRELKNMQLNTSSCRGSRHRYCTNIGSNITVSNNYNPRPALGLLETTVHYARAEGEDYQPATLYSRVWRGGSLMLREQT